LQTSGPSKTSMLSRVYGEKEDGGGVQKEIRSKPMSAIALVRLRETSKVANVFASCSVMIRVTSQDLYVSSLVGGDALSGFEFPSLLHLENSFASLSKHCWLDASHRGSAILSKQPTQSNHICLPPHRLSSTLLQVSPTLLKLVEAQRISHAFEVLV
jgi:hypothetical protein